LKLGQYSQWKFGMVLGIGAVIALVLCVQCVRTYLYADSVLVPEQAEHEAERQAGALSAAARSAGITAPLALGPLVEHAMESTSDRILSTRVLDRDGTVLLQRGLQQSFAAFSPNWWERVEKREKLGTQINTPQGRALVVTLPLRLARPLHSPSGTPSDLRGQRPDDRRNGYGLELTISLKAVANTFSGLRQNLIVGLIASFALLASLAVIGLRAPHYVRGKYLENELQLARRVQSDLQPKENSVAAHVDFAACAVAADHVGGDFYDIFEAEPGKIALVLGDVSGKGVPAALLVSVLHGAIRSASTSGHELALERINRMLCERTAGERFATLFWGIFDPESRMLHYVNAGHMPPMLVREGQTNVERLVEGGPVLGLLPRARYSAGSVHIDGAATLVLYSDGVTETVSHRGEEFGDSRVEEVILSSPDGKPERICRSILTGVTGFSGMAAPQDDRTLLVVHFRNPECAVHDRRSEALEVAVA
jgi:hypothetical protein